MMHAALFALLVAACGETPCTWHEIELKGLPSELVNGDCLGVDSRWGARIVIGEESVCDPGVDWGTCTVITSEQLANPELMPHFFVGSSGEYEMVRALVPCNLRGCPKIRRAAWAQQGDGE